MPLSSLLNDIAVSDIAVNTFFLLLGIFLSNLEIDIQIKKK